MITIRLEPTDIAIMKRFNNTRCKKCATELREGDLITRVGNHPPKYYHKDCFRPY
jgi:hypothetical protein